MTTDRADEYIALGFFASSRVARRAIFILGLFSVIVGPMLWMHGLTVAHLTPVNDPLNGPGASSIVWGFMMTIVLGPGLLLLWVRSAMLAVTMKRIARQMREESED